jgi:hypothetical protein
MASTGVLHGIIGALGVVVVGGGLYIAKQEGAFSQPMTAAAPAPALPPASSPAKPPAAVAPQPAPPAAAAPSGTSQAEALLAQQLVVDARRAIMRVDFDSAGRALDQAERLNPGSPDVIGARRELREAKQRASRGDRRVDSLVADKLLDQAERIDRGDRDVQQARAELNAAQQPAAAPAPGRR